MGSDGRFERKYALPALGDTFGNYTVLQVCRKPSGGVSGVLCRCACGWQGRVYFHSLLRGASTRCRSCAMEKSAKTRRRYAPEEVDRDHVRRLTNRISAAVARCTDPHHPQWPGYGGRGIAVHPEWLRDRTLWLDHLRTLPGWDDPGATCDRIDNDRGYEPGNIRFVSHSRQQSNKRQTVWVEYQGVRMAATEFWREYCPRYLSLSTVLRKISEGKSTSTIVEEQSFCRGAYRARV